jgi:hypothetical protein
LEQEYVVNSGRFDPKKPAFCTSERSNGQGHLRDSAFWRKQEAMLLNAFQQAFDAPIVRQIYLATIDQMQATRQRQVWPDPAMEAIWSALETRLFGVSLSMLARAMCTQSPALTHALGPYMQRWLMAILAVDALGDPWPATWQMRLYRCLPDLPVVRMPDGSYRGLEALDAKQGHFYQLRDLLHALRPMKPRGRPKKQASHPKTPKQQRLVPPWLPRRMTSVPMASTGAASRSNSYPRTTCVIPSAESRRAKKSSDWCMPGKGMHVPPKKNCPRKKSCTRKNRRIFPPLRPARYKRYDPTHRLQSFEEGWPYVTSDP